MEKAESLAPDINEEQPRKMAGTLDIGRIRAWLREVTTWGTSRSRQKRLTVMRWCFRKWQILIDVRNLTFCTYRYGTDRFISPLSLL